MGSKGSTTAPPTTTTTTDDSGMMEMMMMMMSSMAAQEPASVAIPDPIEAPAVVSAEEVDWSAATEELDAQAKADYAEETADDKTRRSTIHSSLTDQDEETEMNTSLLGK